MSDSASALPSSSLFFPIHVSVLLFLSMVFFFLSFSSYLLLTTSSYHITQLLFSFSFWQSSLILSLLFAFTDSFQYLVIHGFSHFSVIIVSIIHSCHLIFFPLRHAWLFSLTLHLNIKKCKVLITFLPCFLIFTLAFSLNIMFLLSPLSQPPKTIVSIAFWCIYTVMSPDSAHFSAYSLFMLVVSLHLQSSNLCFYLTFFNLLFAPCASNLIPFCLL